MWDAEGMRASLQQKNIDYWSVVPKAAASLVLAVFLNKKNFPKLQKNCIEGTCVKLKFGPPQLFM